jgi:uroporphyrinogen decarboxylase
MVHTGLVPLFQVSFGDFFTKADVMAQVMIRGYRHFAFDGVQLSLGVTGEAEALGAYVEQPADAAPILKEYLLADLGNLGRLRRQDPTAGGRMPLFFDAVERVVREIGDEAFVLATLRGPFLTASQLRGVEQTLIDTIERPKELAEVLDFTTEIILKLGRWLLASGAHGLLLGEATCSPNFISPTMYRELVLPHHQRLVNGLKKAQWKTIGMHICGNTAPIIEDIIFTGADFMDVDYQVPVEEALDLAAGRIVLRGNLDPSSVFRFGTSEDVRAAAEAVCRAVGKTGWIMSSGCDIPPGTPAENITAFVETVVGLGEKRLRGILK